MFGRNTESLGGIAYERRLSALSDHLAPPPEMDPSVLPPQDTLIIASGLKGAPYDASILGSKEAWLKSRDAEANSAHISRIEAYLRRGIKALFISGLIGAVAINGPDTEKVTASGTVGYQSDAQVSASTVPDIRPGDRRKPEKTTTTKQNKKTNTSPKTSKATVETTPSTINKPEIPIPAGVDAKTAEAIKAVNFTEQGYRDFLASGIDTSHMAYAKQFVEFDPERVRIAQGKTSSFIWHYTAFYRNVSGPSPVADGGPMLVPPLIKGMAEKGDTDQPPDKRCCGVNFLIDRYGKVYQLSTASAKLQHNPPFNQKYSGVEAEATSQPDIITKQYESLGYLTIAVLKKEELVGQPLDQVAQGHGELRTEYRKANPGTNWDVRTDFSSGPANMLRTQINNFLQSNPQIKSIPVIIA